MWKWQFNWHIDNKNVIEHCYIHVVTSYWFSEGTIWDTYQREHVGVTVRCLFERNFFFQNQNFNCLLTCENLLDNFAKVHFKNVHFFCRCAIMLILTWSKAVFNKVISFENKLRFNCRHQCRSIHLEGTPNELNTHSSSYYEHSENLQGSIQSIPLW